MWTYILVLVSVLAFTNYKYQQYVIEKQNKEIKELSTSLTNVIRISEGTAKVVTAYTKNSAQEATKSKQLVDSIPRVEEIAKKKPTLLASLIEKSYREFHTEKACYSGNKEACKKQ